MIDVHDRCEWVNVSSGTSYSSYKLVWAITSTKENNIFQNVFIRLAVMLLQCYSKVDK